MAWLRSSLDEGLITWRQLLQHLDFSADIHEKATELSALISYLPEEERERSLSQSLHSMRAERSVFIRAKAFVALFRHFNDTERSEFLAEILKQARAGESPARRAMILTLLVPCIEDEQREAAITEAVEAARCAGPLARAYAISGLSPYFPDTERTALWREALDIAKSLDPNMRRCGLLREILQNAPEAQRIAAVAEILEIAASEGDFFRGYYLNWIAPHVPERFLPRAFRIARTSRGSRRTGCRARVTCAVRRAG